MKYTQEQINLWKVLTETGKPNNFPLKCYCLKSQQEVICMGILQNEGNQAVIVSLDNKISFQNPKDIKIINTNFYRNQRGSLVIDRGDYFARQAANEHYVEIMIASLKTDYPKLDFLNSGAVGIRCVNNYLHQSIDLGLEPKFLEGAKLERGLLYEGKWNDITLEEAHRKLKKWNSLSNFS